MLLDGAYRTHACPISASLPPPPSHVSIVVAWIRTDDPGVTLRREGGPIHQAFQGPNGGAAAAAEECGVRVRLSRRSRNGAVAGAVAKRRADAAGASGRRRPSRTKAADAEFDRAAEGVCSVDCASRGAISEVGCEE